MAFSRGKYSKAISDRSGMEFPYNEMVKEWTGALVHVSEFEPKQPQLQPPYHRGDAQALSNPRPDRKQLPTSTLMGANPFTTNGTTTVTVFQQDHGFSANDIVRFMDVNISENNSKSNIILSKIKKNLKPIIVFALILLIAFLVFL